MSDQGVPYPERLVPFMTPAEIAELDQIWAFNRDASSFGGSVPRGWQLRLYYCERVMKVLNEVEARKKAWEAQHE